MNNKLSYRFVDSVIESCRDKCGDLDAAGRSLKWERGFARQREVWGMRDSAAEFLAIAENTARSIQSSRGRVKMPVILRVRRNYGRKAG